MSDALLARASRLFAVRDAIAEHLGEEGARMLGVQLAACAWQQDAIEVSTPHAGFVITARAFEHEAWREHLARNLDALVERPT